MLHVISCDGDILFVVKKCRKDIVPGCFKFVPLILRSRPAFSEVKVTGIRDLSLGVPSVACRHVEVSCCVPQDFDCVPETFIRKRRNCFHGGFGFLKSLGRP